MVFYSPETSKNHTNERFEHTCSFSEHFLRCPRHQEQALRTIKYLECCLSTTVTMEATVATIVALKGMSRPNNGSECRIGGSTRKFLLYMLQNAETNVNLRVEEMDYLLMEYIQVNKATIIFKAPE